VIAELGNLALVTALLAAAVQGACGIAGGARGDAALGRVARRAGYAQLVLVALSFAALTACFVRDDFSVLYVATNSNTALPLIYKFAAVWGAHEGSLLLWALILMAWIGVAGASSAALPEEVRARLVGALGLVSVGFLSFLIFTSNPFVRLLPAAMEGRDLNPLLQDPAMAAHPPMLYVGYVGMALPFAFAVAVLLTGRLERDWVRWVRPWVTVAWTALTLGIALGSWWAYYELGWGGWWFWDPVENASFMPWLVGTALLHSLIVTEKRGAFVGWSLLLAIAAFSLSLLGTFLVRSGVLVSVHAFASDPLRGVFILLFLMAVVGGALTLFAARAPALASEGGSQPVSRETFLLLNNALLVTAAGAVLLGTLYPLFLDAFELGRISVGPPYFNAVFVPLMLPLLIAAGIGATVRWKRDEGARLVALLRAPAVVAVLAAAALVALLFALHDAARGTTGLLTAAVAAVAAAWAVVAAGLEPLRFWRETRRVPRAVLGMALAHLGVGVTALGITFVSALGVERDVALSVGAPVEVAGRTFEVTGFEDVRGPNYEGVRAQVLVTDPSGASQVLGPEKRTYTAGGMPMTEAAIDGGPLRDLYVALGEPLGGGAWAARVQVKPLVRWIWFGAILMALGGLLALSGGRREAAR
jgi:cytochrome c-type biogenesis protein CcmF